jgi:hypothetical protein
MHVDLGPSDVGLGPYDLPVESAGRTAWDFASGDEGWGSGMNLADIRVSDGVLSAQSSGNDPAFFSPPLKAPAERFTALVLRMKLTPADSIRVTDSAQIFWKTTRLPESEATSQRFAVMADGQWHEYRVRLADNVRWRGVVTRLRLDPCNRSDVKVELDALRFER